MTHPPQRHEAPQESRKRCRCGAKVSFFWWKGSWKFELSKEFRAHGRRWHMHYNSLLDQTAFIHHKVGEDDWYDFDRVVSVRRFKKLLIFT